MLFILLSRLRVHGMVAGSPTDFCQKSWIYWDIYQLCHGDVFLGYIGIYWDKNIGIFHEYGGYRRMQWGHENAEGHGE